MADELILHHYPVSPYSEKIRLALGLKNLGWRSLEVSWVMPRPYTTPLTGGYRRVPVLQVGADIYCDTALIARELERRFPEPTLFPDDSRGLASMLGGWADSRFFTAAMIVTLGGMGDALPPEFVEDRKNMAGSRFDLDRMRAGLPAMRDQYRAQLGWIDEQLGDGRDYLLGKAPGWADINAYFNCFFVRRMCPAEAGPIDGFERLPDWEKRMQAIGHGSPEPIDGEQALAIARAAEPRTEPATDPGEPNGLRSGDAVAVTADDYAKNPVTGELVASSAQHIAIRRVDEKAGAIVIHFPRTGYVVSRA